MKIKFNKMMMSSVYLRLVFSTLELNLVKLVSQRRGPSEYPDHSPLYMLGFSRCRFIVNNCGMYASF